MLLRAAKHQSSSIRSTIFFHTSYRTFDYRVSAPNAVVLLICASSTRSSIPSTHTKSYDQHRTHTYIENVTIRSANDYYRHLALHIHTIPSTRHCLRTYSIHNDQQSYLNGAPRLAGRSVEEKNRCRTHTNVHNIISSSIFYTRECALILLSPQKFQFISASKYKKKKNLRSH